MAVVGQLNGDVTTAGAMVDDDAVNCRIVPFVPGRRPHDEDTRPGLGSSDNVTLVTGEERDNRAVLLFEVSVLTDDASV